MKSIVKKLTALSLAGPLVLASSCTNLNETIYSEIIAENFYNSKIEVLQAVLRPMTHMQAWMAPTGGNGYYYHNELSADQLAWPQKGRHGYDGGDHIRQHYHTWTFEEGGLRTAWQLIWEGIGYTNVALADLEQVDFTTIEMTEEDKSAILAELKVMRAYHYMRAMDLWGNIPIVTKAGEPINPPTATSAEVFEFVEQELTENVPKLQPLSHDLVGRITKPAGYAMLAELYLNAQKWSGTVRWQDCIAACDQILDGQDMGGLNGALDLDDDIKSAFSNTNDQSKENILQFAFSQKGGFSFGWAGFFVGYGDTFGPAFDNGLDGWNALVVIPSAFDAFEENDLRKRDWFVFGPLYRFGTKTPMLGTEEYLGRPFVLVNSIRRESEGDKTSEGSMTEGEENSGARFNKYKSGRLSDENYLENDYVLYRLTEIYFNKAEALMRENGGRATAEAVQLMNDCRKRAYSAKDWPREAYTASTLTLEELLAERGREFFFEGKRRTDMIRFGAFTTESWWDHEPSDPTRELFPIPQSQLAANPNLKQNKGYPSVAAE